MDRVARAQHPCPSCQCPDNAVCYDNRVADLLGRDCVTGWRDETNEACDPSRCEETETQSEPPTETWTHIENLRNLIYERVPARAAWAPRRTSSISKQV
jgi:hypothetical protein